MYDKTVVIIIMSHTCSHSSFHDRYDYEPLPILNSFPPETHHRRNVELVSHETNDVIINHAYNRQQKTMFEHQYSRFLILGAFVLEEKMKLQKQHYCLQASTKVAFYHRISRCLVKSQNQLMGNDISRRLWSLSWLNTR